MPATSTSAPRFSLRGLFMTVAAVAIGLAFWRSEGCEGRRQGITNMAFSPDGKWLAVNCYDTGTYWKTRTYSRNCDKRTMLYRVDGSQPPVEMYGQYVPGVSSPLWTLQYDKPIAFSADSSSVYFTDDDQKFAFRFDLSRPQSAENKFATMPSHITALWWCGAENAMWAIDLESMNIQRLRAPGTLPRPQPIIYINSQVQPGAKLLAGGELITTQRNYLMVNLPHQPAVMVLPDEFRSRELPAISSDFRYAVTANYDGVYSYDFESGGTKSFEDLKNRDFGACAFASDSQKVFVLGYRLVELNLETSEVKTLQAFYDYKSEIAGCAATNQLAIGGKDTIEIWDIAQKRFVQKFTLPRGSYVPYFMPWLALVVWLLVAKRMWFPRPFSAYERLRTQQRRERRQQAAIGPGEDGA